MDPNGSSHGLDVPDPHVLDLLFVAVALLAAPMLTLGALGRQARAAWSRRRVTIGTVYRTPDADAEHVTEGRIPLAVKVASTAALAAGQMVVPLAGLLCAWFQQDGGVEIAGVYTASPCPNAEASALFTPTMWCATVVALGAAICFVAAGLGLFQKRVATVRWANVALGLSALLVVLLAVALTLAGADPHVVVFNRCVVNSGSPPREVGSFAVQYTSMTTWSALAAFACSPSALAPSPAAPTHAILP